MFLPARPPIRRPLFPLRRGPPRRQSWDGGLAVVPSSQAATHDVQELAPLHRSPNWHSETRCFPSSRLAPGVIKASRRPSGAALLRLPDAGGRTSAAKSHSGYSGYSESPMLPTSAGSHFYSDASEPFMTRLAAALGRSLVEHYGSLTRAYRAITPPNCQMSLSDWEQELQPLMEHLEECTGQTLPQLFTQIQTREASASNSVSYETWWLFFEECLHDSHCEHLLSQDLGPRSRRQSRDASPIPGEHVDKSKVTHMPAEQGPLKTLMSRQQVATELHRRYSSSGLNLPRIHLLPAVEAPV